MKLLDIINRISSVLQKEDCSFCLIGGHAASLYRSKERFTRDVDFALLARPRSHSEAVAIRAIEALGMKPVAGFIPRKEGERKRRSIALVTSQPRKGELTGEIDILLPELPWIVPAIERAQHNLIDLGFAKIPVITPEDLVIAKCYALANSPDRFQDLDDLKELFENVRELDRDYIQQGLKRCGVSIPAPLKKLYKKNRVEKKRARKRP